MRNALQYILWSLIVSLWSVVLFTIPYFIDSPIEGWVGIMWMFVYIGACSIGTFLLLYVIGTNKYVCAVLLPLWAIVGSSLAFYRVGYHTTLTPMLIDAALHTNTEEAIGVITWQLIAWILLNIAISCLFVLWRWRKIHLSYIWIHAIVASMLCLCYLTINNRLYNSICQRFPYNVSYNIKEYLSLQHKIKSKREVPPFTITDRPDSLIVVLIIGESVRADHLQLNNYSRETTPRLFKRNNIISFPHIYSEYTHTLASVPHILTRSDSINENYQFTESSFFPIFKQAGFHTAWISNQDQGSTFGHFISESDTTVFANAGKSDYVYSTWLDEELVPIMNSIFFPHPPLALYVLHSIGSHWYYNTHVPEDKYYYQPITTNRIIALNSIEQVINSYDNTVRYMDFFIDSVIMQVENKNAIIIYQSDHGEALGEDGEFLHANDVNGVKNPACIIWYSDQYATTYPEKVRALIKNQNKHYRTDYVFYSILYAAGIEADGDNPNMNIFK